MSWPRRRWNTHKRQRAVLSPSAGSRRRRSRPGARTAPRPAGPGRRRRSRPAAGRSCTAATARPMAAERSRPAAGLLPGTRLSTTPARHKTPRRGVLMRCPRERKEDRRGEENIGEEKERRGEENRRRGTRTAVLPEPDAATRLRLGDDGQREGRLDPGGAWPNTLLAHVVSSQLR